MNKEAQRIAIAEACGWQKCGWSPSWSDKERKLFQWDSDLPDYPNDLNAMREAVNMLPPDLRDKYWQHLAEIVNREHRMATTWWLGLTSTAVQQSEAFLRTIGKWDAKPKEGV